MQDEPQDVPGNHRLADLLRQAGVDQEVIADLRRQAVEDRAQISRLRGRGGGEHDQLVRLEAQAVIDAEMIAALTEQGVLDQAEIGNLRLALASSRRIGAAIGILMATERLDEQGAFRLLRTVSQNTHRKLRDVAEYVVYSGALN